MKAKNLITGVTEGDEAGQPPAPGGPPGGPSSRRPGPGPRRGPPGAGPEDGPDGGLSPQEQSALKDLVILDLLSAFANGDTFYEDLAAMALAGKAPDRAQAQHFLQEAGKWAKQFGPQHNALMNKIATSAS